MTLKKTRKYLSDQKEKSTFSSCFSQTNKQTKKYDESLAYTSIYF